MRAVGFNQGQLGDLAINLVVARAFKQKYPDAHLTFSINKKYAGAAPIFKRNPLVDDIKIWDGYDEWPTELDHQALDEYARDGVKVFNPNPKVVNPKWFLTHHHTEEVCYMHGLTPPEDLSVHLVQYFDLDSKYKNAVAFAPFTSAGAARDIPFEYAQRVVDMVHKLGFETVQLGLPSAPKLNTTYGIVGGSVFDDVVVARSCKLLVTADTGINYIMSGYKHPILGLYSRSCYAPYNALLSNRTPRGGKGVYLEGYNIDDIELPLVESELKSLLC